MSIHQAHATSLGLVPVPDDAAVVANLNIHRLSLVRAHSCHWGEDPRRVERLLYAGKLHSSAKVLPRSCWESRIRQQPLAAQSSWSSCPPSSAFGALWRFGLTRGVKLRLRLWLCFQEGKRKRQGVLARLPCGGPLGLSSFYFVLLSHLLR